MSAAAPQTLAPPPKRGRGRPRKYLPPGVLDDPIPSSPILADTPPKRGRGRPRKYRPPPPPPTSAIATPPPPLPASRQLPPTEGLASFSAMLADFLHRWNALLVDAQKRKPSTKHLPVTEPEDLRPPQPEPAEPEPSAAALASICEQMGSFALRRFATANLRDRAWLRRVGPDALLRAPDPAALILRAVNRYYICADSEDDEAACVLLLELCVRAGCPRLLQEEAQEEARVAALSWRSRIARDKGRVADASTMDARGLILLMAAFAVPTEFPVQDLYDLLIAGDCFACADVLKRSHLFLNKLRDVVAHLLNRASYREAIGVILAFELQNVFPLPDTLTCMLDKVVHSRKDQGTEGQGNLAGSKVHDEGELVLWRSINREWQKLHHYQGT